MLSECHTHYRRIAYFLSLSHWTDFSAFGWMFGWPLKLWATNVFYVSLFHIYYVKLSTDFHVLAVLYMLATILNNLFRLLILSDFRNISTVRFVCLTWVRIQALQPAVHVTTCSVKMTV